MKKLVFCLVTLSVVILAFLSCSKRTGIFIPTDQTSYGMKVTFAPKEVKSTNGKINLLYSVELLNFEKDGYKLKDFQAINSITGTVLCSLSDTGKYLLVHKPVIESIPEELFYYPLVGHATYRFSVGLVLDPAQVPTKIKHRLVLTKDAKDKIIEAAETSVSKGSLPIASAPLKGDRFVSANTTTLVNNQHPGYQITYRGITGVPERFCVDWNKLDATGSAYHGDMKICTNWYVYGQNVYSVAEGSVVSVSDGMPDQSPVGTVSSDINLYNGGGNSVMIYIDGVGYTIYGHMIPNSIVVKAGQMVAKGQLIGKVGNSGNSMAPHLHFGLHTDFPYYISEGLPYCIDSMEKIGSTGKPLGPLVLLPVSEIHTNELVENCGVYNLK
ncbi:MAG: M23 family metallopeptidase [Bacteroidia bacterium]|nr:M23 family metallopeptidase [Bacteroidia bacterium]